MEYKFEWLIKKRRKFVNKWHMINHINYNKTGIHRRKQCCKP